MRSLLLATALLATSSAAHADAWSTATHFGYAVSQRSTTGFARVGGSLVYLDVARDVAPSTAVGLRTMAQGGRTPDLEFYRMGSGPFVSWAPTEGWRLEASYGLFRESGLDAEGQDVYRSTGRAWLLGWERSTALYPRVECAWGGFLMGHQGSLRRTDSAETPVAAATIHRLAGVDTNAGLSQGIQIALRVRL